MPAVFEVEPNDTPATANPIAGAVRVLGTMASGDQDGFLWTVSDVDAQQRWTFELQGIPGTLTVLEVIRLDYAEDGVSVTGRKVLFGIGSRDGSRAGIAEDVLFEPGQYLLGLARAGDDVPFRPPIAAAGFDGRTATGKAAEAAAGGYRLNIRQGAAFTMTSSPADPASRESAMPVIPGYGYLGYAAAADSWFEVVIDEHDEASQIDLYAQVPAGHDLALTLFDPSGEMLSRAASGERGRLRMPELALAAGRYMAQLRSTPETLRVFTVERGGTRVEGSEAEPNDEWRRANRIDLEEVVTGRFQQTGDTDYFVFPVTAAQSEERLSLEAIGSDDQLFTLCLLDHQGMRLQCRTGQGTVRLGGLVLEPGDYGLSMAYGMEGTGYRLQLGKEGAHNPGLEAEPNDDFTKATNIPGNQRIKGLLHSEDKDFFRIIVDGEPQLWRFQVLGDGVHDVTYHDGSGTAAQSVRTGAEQRRVTLDKLFLLPGVHYVSVSGNDDGEYTLVARPLGPPDPNDELEPNDDPTRMLPLAVGQVRTGTLPDSGDRDNYRFYLANHDHVRLRIAAPPDGWIRALIYWDGTPIGESAAQQVGGELLLEGLFPPGDYRVELIAAKPSDAEYRINLERLARFACPVDCEPNNNPAFASALPAGGKLSGKVGEWRDDDWYALPVSEEAAAIVIETDQRYELALASHLYDYDRSRLIWDETQQRYTGTIPAGEQYFLKVSGDGSYAMTVRLDQDAARVESAATAPLRLALALDHDRVAAYQPYGQRIEGRLELANPGDKPIKVALNVASSDARWSAVPEPAAIILGAGATASAALRITAPDDAWADRPVRISVQATSVEAGTTETFRDITVDRDGALLNPLRHWTVPEPLRGGLNLAWRSMGSRRIPMAEAEPGLGHGEIFDGMAIRDEGLGLPAMNEPWAYHATVELAGNAAVEIAGIALHPAGRGSAADFLRRFALALSVDGREFQTVFTGLLEPRPVEQYFVLQKPQKARFARLHLLDDFTGNAGGVRGLGEWKVIARPGVDISGGAGFNLADPALGGHVVWSRPMISHRWDDEILALGTEPAQVRLRAGDVLEWVVGFHHNRAARIAAIDWVDSPAGGAHQYISTVDVAVSTDSPLGPWKAVGTIKLQGDDLQRLVLGSAEWARFVRFTTSPATADAFVDAPGELRIHEQPSSASYRSILGEWGFDSHRAGFEAQQPISPARPFERAAHGTRASAAPLLPGQAVNGRVMLGQHEHWYRLQMPADHNMLDIRLAGEQTVRTTLSLETAVGEVVPHRVIRRGTNEHRLEAFAAPGSELYVRVVEPPRNVVFAWDTSASVGAYLPVIYNAMASYARGLVPGRDAANLMPFGGPLLLQEWYGEPYLLQTILNEYPRDASSSESEETLAAASEALAQRAGAKAIVLITDAATGRYSDVWDAFEGVRPRVLALALDSHGAFNRDPPREQDLMQDWAQVNGGHYAHLRSEGEMEVAFDRAAMLLREPAPYLLTMNTEHRKAPGPGRLTVESRRGVHAADKGGTDGDGILLILDASGSMLQRMDGRRRIEIAREVLIEAVTEHLRPGTPVALRVFGHREPNACRSDLEIPLSPLEPAAAAAVIRRVEARNLARTPIADSLALAESDLGAGTGTRTIVLLTDGEETCEGDPEAVIRRLTEKGLDVRLNVIGFALDDPAVEAQFNSWARLGGGNYFKAGNAEALRRALVEALRTPFVVYDREGTPVAQGLVGGEPVELTAGMYRVLVKSSPPQSFERVEIHGGATIQLDLK